MAFTYFFKDLQTIEEIRDSVLPNLNVKELIDIWVAGCEKGQEPYSLSMILNDSMGYVDFRNVRILATDTDESNLYEEIITNASYPSDEIRQIPRGISNRFFHTGDQEGYFKLNEDIRKSVNFRKHDLLSFVPPEKGFGLILCTNAFLHYDEEQKMKIIKMFYDALAAEGYLAFNQMEKMPPEAQHLFIPIKSDVQIYKRKFKTI